MASPINTLRVIIFYVIMTVSAFLGVIFIQTPSVPLAFLNRRLYFRWCSRAIGHYLLMVTCLIEDLLGIKVVITGDDIMKENKRSIITLNHRTRLDWMFLWMLDSRLGILHQLKTVLKSSLKQVPGPGWAMQHSAYMFFERNWEKDQKTIASLCAYYKSCQASISLLLFPEGTNFSNETKEKSNNFASKQTMFNRPYEYCLHPRVTGFVHLLNTMKKNELIDTVDDITVGYEGNIPETEMDLITGRIPSVIHFHVKRYNVDDLPKTDEEIGTWLLLRWDEKENRLKEFYQENKFDDSSNYIMTNKKESEIRLQRRIALVLWLVFLGFWSYCIISFMKIRFFILLVCFFHLIMDTFANGIIDFVCQLDENYRQHEVKRTQQTLKQD